MLFSVIIPTYNRLQLLPRTLESIWAQSFADFEVIVVDDGSTDGTGTWLEQFGDRVQLLRQSNQGGGSARNFGASHAHGDYIAFLDSDDLWFPWTLATFAALIRDHDTPAIVSAHFVEFRDEPELCSIREERIKADLFPDYLSASRAGYFVGAGMSVLRREEFLRVGGYTERRINGEDHDLILRLGTASRFARLLQPVTLAWRRHAQGATVDLALSIEGSRWLIEQERSGNYPGGPPRSRERREIILRHVRPVALECLRKNMKREAWELYRATLRWHVQLRRWKFLLGFPLKALVS